MTVSAPQLGKTMLLVLWLLSGAWHDGGRVPWASWWTAPTYDQVRHGFLNAAVSVVALARSAGILYDHTSSPPLKARLINGSVIEARSWDSPEGLYGPTVARMASDEFGGMTPEASAALSSRLRESAIRGYGYWRLAGNVAEIGGEAESLWRLAGSRQGWARRTWTWRDRAAATSCACDAGRPIGISIEPESVDRHRLLCERGIYLRGLSDERAKMSANHFRQLYEAEWIDWSTLPAYEFSRAVHVTTDVHEEPTLPLDLSCDFNVDPMGWCVGQHTAKELWAFDEIAIPGGATSRQAAQKFLERYPGHKSRELHVYGDASGSARSTKSHQSDYDIIRETLKPHWPNLKMQVPAANGPVVDRLNAVNAMLAPGSGSPKYYLHPRCERLANDFARVSLKPGTRDIDKTKDRSLTHFSDAEGYRIVRLFPITGKSSISKPDWEVSSVAYTERVF